LLVTSIDLLSPAGISPYQIKGLRSGSRHQLSVRPSQTGGCSRSVARVFKFQTP